MPKKKKTRNDGLVGFGGSERETRMKSKTEEGEKHLTNRKNMFQQMNENPKIEIKKLIEKCTHKPNTININVKLKWCLCYGISFNSKCETESHWSGEIGVNN